MKAQYDSTPVILLSRSEAGENHQRFDALSPTQGLILCLYRRPKRPSSATAPDLFDHAQVEIEQPSDSHSWFIREYHLQHRYNGLGANYRALHYASSWARFLTRNLRYVEQFEAVFALTLRAFAALESGPHPEVVYLKSLYRFVREEGFAVREHWRARLDSNDRELARTVLHQPLDEQASHTDAVEKLIASLHRWLQSETDFVL